MGQGNHNAAKKRGEAKKEERKVKGPGNYRAGRISRKPLGHTQFICIWEPSSTSRYEYVKSKRSVSSCDRRSGRMTEGASAVDVL